MERVDRNRLGPARTRKDFSPALPGNTGIGGANYAVTFNAGKDCVAGELLKGDDIEVFQISGTIFPVVTAVGGVKNT